MPLRRAHTAVAVAAWLTSSLIPSRAEAQVAAPCAAYWNADAVFVGRVEAVKRSGNTRVASFAVLDGFHGVTSNVTDVATTPVAHEYCPTLKVGHEYFVYARRSDTAGGSGTGGLRLCSLTREVEDAGADLSYARDVRQGIAPPGFIAGHVFRVPRTLAGKTAALIEAVPNIAVTLSRDATTETVVTSAGGGFRVDTPGAGTYRISVEVPERFYSDAPVTTVMLRDPRSCADVGVALHDNGRLSGRVVDSAGRPVAGLTLDLGTAGSGQGSPSPSFGEARRSLGGGGRRTVTDRDGRYALARIPSGRFVLSVPAGPSRARGGRPIRIFHPGVTMLAAATRVGLAAGEHLGLADFRLPADQSYVPVSGIVFDAAGMPAEGARVYLKGVGEDDRIVSEPVAVDFVGRFVIAALAGTDYLLFAERSRPEGRSSRTDSTDQLRLTAVEGLKPVRLRLERRY